MANTGTKIYLWLREIDAITGIPTGQRKLNDPSDIDYIPPVYDPIFCPIPITTTTTTTTTTPFPGLNCGMGPRTRTMLLVDSPITEIYEYGILPGIGKFSYKINSLETDEDSCKIELIYDGTTIAQLSNLHNGDYGDIIFVWNPNLIDTKLHIKYTLTPTITTTTLGPTDNNSSIYLKVGTGFMDTADWNDGWTGTVSIIVVVASIETILSTQSVIYEKGSFALFVENLPDGDYLIRIKDVVIYNDGASVGSGHGAINDESGETLLPIPTNDYNFTLTGGSQAKELSLVINQDL